MSETVHDRIALLRTEQDVTRRGLADALGLHDQTIGSLERGPSSPSPQRLTVATGEDHGVVAEECLGRAAEGRNGTARTGEHRCRGRAAREEPSRS